MIDVRTKMEKLRDERNKRICERYVKMSQELPNCSANRIITVIAEQEGMTIPGVKHVLIANGEYKTRNRNNV